MPVPADLSKISDLAKNDVITKPVYDKLVEKVNNIDTSRFVLETKYDTDKSEIENKIPDTSELLKKADGSVKTSEIENKIPSISGFATNAALTAAENNTPDVSSLVKKTEIITQKLVKLKQKLLIIIMRNILILQNLIT